MRIPRSVAGRARPYRWPSRVTRYRERGGDGGALAQSSIIGFYDPCVGEPKQLRIVYQFQRRRHEVTVNDLDPVDLPMRCTVSARQA